MLFTAFLVHSTAFVSLQWHQRCDTLSTAGQHAFIQLQYIQFLNAESVQLFPCSYLTIRIFLAKIHSWEAISEQNTFHAHRNFSCVAVACTKLRSINQNPACQKYARNKFWVSKYSQSFFSGGKMYPDLSYSCCVLTAATLWPHHFQIAWYSWAAQAVHESHMHTHLDARCVMINAVRQTREMTSPT